MGSLSRFITGASFTEYLMLLFILLAVSDVWPGLAATIAGFVFMLVAVQKFGG